MKFFGFAISIFIAIFFWSCNEKESNQNTLKDAEVRDESKETNRDELTFRYPKHEFFSQENPAMMRDSLYIFDNFAMGLLEAQKTDKPILLYFTGHAVTNARRVEDQLFFKNKSIFQKMKKDYINVWLYCDDVVIGKKNMKLHYNMTESITLPSIVIFSSKGIPAKMLLDYEVIVSDLEKSL